MNIYDPLYGRFELSEISAALCTLPEVRRLSQIRLLNSISPTLATLSELRRYAHTLGVLHLFNLWKASVGRRYSTSEVDALEVAIILHDIATPPFGHLFEYVLKETLGWDHESAAVMTLLKSYSSASTGQQIYAGRTPKVLDYIERRHIDLDLVKAILTKNHRFSALIMGVLDFDNLDNVWRMAWGLGLSRAVDGGPEEIASQLDIDPNGRLQIERGCLGELAKWSRLRRMAYEVLIFDQATVASQTVLSHCIKEGLKKNLISTEDWYLNDESLLVKLSADANLKILIDQQYLGQLPNSVVTLQVKWSALQFCGWAREQIESAVRDRIQPIIGDGLWVYIFKERGSFSKAIQYVTSSGESSVFGETSRSIVLSVFSSKELPMHQQRAAASALLRLLEEWGVEGDDLLCVIDGNHEGPRASGNLNF